MYKHRKVICKHAKILLCKKHLQTVVQRFDANLCTTALHLSLPIISKYVIPIYVLYLPKLFYKKIGVHCGLPGNEHQQKQKKPQGICFPLGLCIAFGITYDRRQSFRHSGRQNRIRQRAILLISTTIPLADGSGKSSGFRTRRLLRRCQVWSF